MRIAALEQRAAAALAHRAGDQRLEIGAQPDRDAARAATRARVSRIDERAASQRQHHGPAIEQPRDHPPLQLAEARLAVEGEDVGDAQPGGRDDLFVGVGEGCAQRPRQPAADRRLARAHQARPARCCAPAGRALRRRRAARLACGEWSGASGLDVELRGPRRYKAASSRSEATVSLRPVPPAAGERSALAPALLEDPALLRLLLLALLLVVVGGAVFLVTWDIPAPTRQVETSCPTSDCPASRVDVPFALLVLSLMLVGVPAVAAGGAARPVPGPTAACRGTTAPRPPDCADRASQDLPAPTSPPLACPRRRPHSPGRSGRRRAARRSSCCCAGCRPRSTSRPCWRCSAPCSPRPARPTAADALLAHTRRPPAGDGRRPRPPSTAGAGARYAARRRIRCAAAAGGSSPPARPNPRAPTPRHRRPVASPWPEARVVCAALARDAAAVELGLDLLESRGDPADSTLAGLARAAAAGGALRASRAGAGRSAAAAAAAGGAARPRPGSRSRAAAAGPPRAGRQSRARLGRPRGCQRPDRAPALRCAPS